MLSFGTFLLMQSPSARPSGEMYTRAIDIAQAAEGLGYRILKFSRFLQTPKIWVYLVLLGAIGLGLDLVFRSINRRLFHWSDTTKR